MSKVISLSSAQKSNALHRTLEGTCEELLRDWGDQKNVKALVLIESDEKSLTSYHVNTTYGEELAFLDLAHHKALHDMAEDDE